MGVFLFFENLLLLLLLLLVVLDSDLMCSFGFSDVLRAGWLAGWLAGWMGCVVVLRVVVVGRWDGEYAQIDLPGAVNDAYLKEALGVDKLCTGNSLVCVFVCVCVCVCVQRGCL